ncbi:MAG: hypothetical protein KKE72_05095 [Gammaproteobacteria bacterium]|nr:hypothetical protein [Gammaproteobacteria bacterium]MBU2204058.1 hypothetical protein [Gammaproteobacteria bacterium]
MDFQSKAVINLPADFPYEDLCSIAEFLKHADVFVTGYTPPSVGKYHPDGFLFGSYFEDLNIILLPDRNIVSRIVQIAKGEASNHERMIASAVLAFSQCLDILIEPSIAYHELAPNQGNKAAHEELQWFRAADDSDASHWINIGLGRTDRIFCDIQVKDTEMVNLERPLERWKRNYIVALKIADFELTHMKPVDKVLRLLEWMFEDFILAGPGIILACVYFAPNSPPRAGLFKSLRSSNRARAIAGVRNAAWDLTHLSDFVLRSNSASNGNTRYIFASLDAGLRCISELLFRYACDQNQPHQLAKGLLRWWPVQDAEKIADFIFKYYGAARSADWQNKNNEKQSYIDDLIFLGEAKLNLWSG